ncbi:hypothetical protein PVAND_009118 [Polypedilum vanderplanki]|uniref:R3H domain-containing protein n=1 Tax=Polypedilum vanderplanki TaxID=319348 RepID=A0A9J6CD45_POLVA|nr:hypothetical protein PVAND_009118 [Polypedilum vanderplanki]
MSYNLIDGCYLKCEDDDFMLKVDKDIREYYIKKRDSHSEDNSVLLFPAVNSYYRFLIHRVCKYISNDIANNTLTTFSIGVENQRRTVICHRNQLQINLINSSPSSLKNSQEFSWRYITRNSEPKYTGENNLHQVNHQRLKKKSMGIDATTSHHSTDEKVVSTLPEEDPFNSKKTRRPERKFYVPRAKRSQTTPPLNNYNNSDSTLKIHSKKSEKSKSIDESTSSSASNSEESNDTENPSSLINQLDCTVINSSTTNSFSKSNASCDLYNQNHYNSSEDRKNQKNFDNLQTMSQQKSEDLIISDNSASGSDKIDKDEKELMKASQEINRSNRKLIKQTFNSNVLQIETASGGSSLEDKTEAGNKEDDDWDTLFDDNGDCLDPKMIEELTKAVGKVNIEKPKQDYKAYHSNVDLLKDEEYPHVLECSNFPVEFRTQDLMALFAPYAKESSNGYNIVWVDDTHCLVVFSSSKIAAEVLTASHPIVKMKPLSEATLESRTKARKCSSSLQPYRQRPETCTALAKRLVSGALGVRHVATKEERENEKRLLRKAKERKLQAAKAREEMWNN